MTPWLLALLLANPAPIAAGDLLRDGVRWSARQGPEALEASLRGAFERQHPGVDATATVGLLLVRIGAARMDDAPEDALRLMMRGHALVVRVFPATHPARRAATRATANALRELGHPDTAEPMYATLLAHHRATDGPSHPHTLSLAADLGDTLRRRGAHPEAEATLEGACALAGDAPAPLRARIAGLLARLYAETDRPARADARFVEALDHWGRDPRGAADAVAYADFLTHRHRPTRAAAVLAPLAHTHAEARLALASLLFAQGRYDRASRWAAVGLQATQRGGVDTPESLPWLYRCASAEAAAGRHDAASALIDRARTLAKTHRGQYAQWGQPFRDLGDRLRAARALADEVRVRPERPFPVAPPPALAPDAALDALSAPELAARASAAAASGDFGSAIDLGRRRLALAGVGWLDLARWAAQAGRTEAALGWLFEAAEREGVEPARLDLAPAFASLRADPRWHGVRPWLGRVALDWTVHTPPRTVAGGAAAGPLWIVLPDDGSTPEAALTALGTGASAGARVVALSATWARGPAAFDWAGTAADAAHVRRHLDRLGASGPVLLIGLGAGAAVAARLAADDPDRYTGAVLWGPTGGLGLPPVRVGAAAQRWVVQCAGAAPANAFLDGVRALGAAVRCASSGPLEAARLGVEAQ